MQLEWTGTLYFTSALLHSQYPTTPCSPLSPLYTLCIPSSHPASGTLSGWDAIGWDPHHRAERHISRGLLGGPFLATGRPSVGDGPLWAWIVLWTSRASCSSSSWLVSCGGCEASPSVCTAQAVLGLPGASVRSLCWLPCHFSHLGGGAHPWWGWTVLWRCGGGLTQFVCVSLYFANGEMSMFKYVWRERERVEERRANWGTVRSWEWMGSRELTWGINWA